MGTYTCRPEVVMKNGRHVVPHKDGWAVRKAGASRVSSTHRTQKAAISKAVQSARRERGEVFIHGMDAKFRDRDSYGNDPCPPRDRKH
ncbi:DUF2188 domain-containing protein [Elusimicrobiota bacterium]